MMVSMPSEAADGSAISESDVLKELAIVLYAREKLTIGRAARLAGMDKWAFNDLLADREIPMHYGLKELEQDLATARSLAAR
jgi:predicted HTH domain antitoxin